MVTVKFFNLIRSKYKIKELLLNPGTIKDIISQIAILHPEIQQKDLNSSALFINSKKVTHLKRMSEKVCSGDIIVFTHFVGGG